MARLYYKKKYNNRRKKADTGLLKSLFLLFILPFYLLYIIIELIIKYVNKSKKINAALNDDKLANISNNEYTSKSLVTNYENYFLSIINENFGDDYRIIPQVPLSSIINKNKSFPNQYQSELYRTIDIGIFNKKTFEPLLMIEINDKTHTQSDRYQRDLKVREILKIADIPLLTFYFGMPNNEDYIIDSIEEYLN